MKRLRNRIITGAIQSGTVFYKIELEDAISVLEDDPKTNLFVLYQIRNNGFDAFDTKNMMYGSIAIDDILYLCNTDGHEISVDGENVDPEYALHEYPAEQLSDYIEPGTPEIIKKYLTTYELAPFDIDEVAQELIDGGHKFTTVVEEAYNADLIEL